jgi:hypothetical protein
MQTSDGPYQYTIGTMARFARFKGAGQDSEQAIQRYGRRPQRIRARTGRPPSARAIPGGGLSAAVSVPDGHGMILIEGCVEVRTRHIVFSDGPGSLKNSGL